MSYLSSREIICHCHHQVGIRLIDENCSRCFFLDVISLSDLVFTLDNVRIGALTGRATG